MEFLNHIKEFSLQWQIPRIFMRLTLILFVSHTREVIIHTLSLYISTSSRNISPSRNMFVICCTNIFTVLTMSVRQPFMELLYKLLKSLKLDTRKPIKTFIVSTFPLYSRLFHEIDRVKYQSRSSNQN